jgi:hypothetical protein
MRPCCAAVLLVLLVGCGTTSRRVRLDTGESAPLVFTPRSGANPVALGHGEFKKAMSGMS